MLFNTIVNSNRKYICFLCLSIAFCVAFLYDMIQGSEGHIFHACMKNMTLGPAKHEKAARKGRISNVFRIAGARSAEQSVCIK